MKQKFILFLKILAFPFAIFIQIIITLLVTPFVLRRNRLDKGTEREFNSDKKELLFGEKIAESIKKIEKAGFSVKTITEGKYTKYTLLTKNYSLEIEVNTDALALIFNSFDKNKKSVQIDTDLYPISKPEYHEFAKETEDEIVVFLDSITKNK